MKGPSVPAGGNGLAPTVTEPARLRPARTPWWNPDPAPAPPAAPPPGPVSRAAQWVNPGDAIFVPGTGTAIVTGVITGEAGPRYYRPRHIAYAVLSPAGEVTAEGELTRSAGATITVLPAEGLGRRIALLEDTVTELEARLAGLNDGGLGWEDVDEDMTCTDRYEQARALAAQDLDEQSAILRRLRDLQTVIKMTGAAA